MLQVSAEDVKGNVADFVQTGEEQDGDVRTNVTDLVAQSATIGGLDVEAQDDAIHMLALEYLDGVETVFGKHDVAPGLGQCLLKFMKDRATFMHA